jgi:hypothetical protein
MSVLAALAQNKLAYYSTVAQVIPVLFIAFVFSIGLRGIATPPTTRPLLGSIRQALHLPIPIVVLIFVSFLAQMVLGEWAAIDALLNGSIGHFTNGFVTSGLSAGLALFLIGGVNRLIREARQLQRQAMPPDDSVGPG